MLRISRSRCCSSVQVPGGLRGRLHPHGPLDRVLAGAEDADDAHHERGLATEQVVAADVGVAVGQGVGYLRQRDAEALKPLRVGVHLVAFDRAALAGHVDDSGDPAELTLEQPVFQRLEIVERVVRIAENVLRRGQRIAIDLADRIGRRQHGVDAGRQALDELEAIDHLLPGIS